jgi:hypothetical protein
VDVSQEFKDGKIFETISLTYQKIEMENMAKKTVYEDTWNGR